MTQNSTVLTPSLLSTVLTYQLRLHWRWKLTPSQLPICPRTPYKFAPKRRPIGWIRLSAELRSHQLRAEFRELKVRKYNTNMSKKWTLSSLFFKLNIIIYIRALFFRTRKTLLPNNVSVDWLLIFALYNVRTAQFYAND